MKLNVFVVNTEIIEGEELDKVVDLCMGLDCKRIKSYNHLLLCIVPDNNVQELMEEMEELDLSNPAYEIGVREVNNNEELSALSLIINLEER